MRIGESEFPPENKARSSFRYEADMLQHLVQNANLFTSTLSRVATWSTYFEVPVSTCGIADVLFVEIDLRAVGERFERGFGAILDLNDLRCFIGLQRTKAGMGAETIARRMGLSAAGLRRGSLRRLLEQGHIVADKSQLFFPAWRYSTPVRKIIAVEVKKTDWRSAISQAKNYLAFADTSYIAMEPSAARRALDQTAWVDNLGIGVASVDPATFSVDILRRGNRSSINSSRPHRLLAAEFVLHLTATGSISGPVAPVFGNTLSVSSGIDPRWQESPCH